MQHTKRRLNLVTKPAAIKPKRIGSSTSLALDFFGLGPIEIGICIGTMLVLFGDDFKIQFINKGKDEKINKPNGGKAERLKKLTNLRKRAQSAQRSRAVRRLNTAVEEGEPSVIERINEFEALQE